MIPPEPIPPRPRTDSPEVRQLAIRLRAREMARIHVESLQKKATFSQAQRVALHERIERFLCEVAFGATTLAPNPAQMSEARRQLKEQSNA